jgi:CheY-like chemotaxis protein
MPYGKVLVIDDVGSNLYVAKRLLIPYDLTIETASNGFEAIEKIKAGSVYDVIFMDHLMPKMDGIETVKKIRELKYTHPIVALTANVMAGQEKIFLENGFDDFISKPIDIQQLDSILNKLIRDKQPPDVLSEARENKKTKAVQALSTADSAQLFSMFAQDARRALPIFESVLQNLANVSNEDLQLFNIKAHAMKSALVNIGEVTISHLAFTLEKASKKHNKNTLAQKTHELINALKFIIKNVETMELGSKIVAKDDDIAYLREQLGIIYEACEEYDIKTADEAITNLRKKSWTSETWEVLDKISEYILHSDFEEASLLALRFR